MGLIQLAAQREAIRIRYDLPTFSTSSYVTLAAIDAMINQSLQAYYALLASCFGDDYFGATTTLSTTADTATTALPATFSKLKGLYWLRGSDDVVPLQRVQTDEEHLASLSQQSWDQWSPKYKLFGLTAIRWYPKPSAVYSVRLDYVSMPAALVGESDTYEGGQGWDEWVTLDVCRKLANKEEMDPSVWLMERADVEARIRAQAPNRDEGQALRIRDVYRKRRPGGVCY